MMESKTTSKTSCLKALLLKAWRERWSDLQWGINIKTVLPRGVSGDVYDLADCILQQAVVGSGANQLVLSYLKHSLSAQLVSHAAVLQRLAKFQQLHKVHCVLSLLDFLEGILPGVTCCGKSEGTKLASALQATTYWLLQVVQTCFKNQQIYEKAASILKCLVSNDFYLAMMCLAKYVEPDTYDRIVDKCHEIDCGNDILNDSLRVLLKLDPDILNMPSMDDCGPSCLIQSWLAVQMVINPGSSTYELGQRLRLLQRLKNFPDARLYAELNRGSLVALHDARQTDYESQWGAFSILKVPNLLATMADENENASICNSVELMLEPSSLMNAMDAQQGASNLGSLLVEFGKLNLMSDTQRSQVLAKHETPSDELKLPNDPPNPGIMQVIMCAQQSVTGILKTLSSDTPKVQEAMLGMLNQVLTGKSFELVLAAATVQGHLKTLVQLLVRSNEFSKLGGDKARSQVFDTSFLMLVAIVQRHGASAVLDGCGDSLFETWVRNCMVEPNTPKASEQLLKLCDRSIIDALLRQFNTGEPDFISTLNLNWQDVLFNMPGVMKEIWIAWEEGSIQPSDVRRILDAIRGRMCCLPLAAAAWVCAYMTTASNDTLVKPFNLIYELLLKAPNADDDIWLGERWQLACEIIRKMQRDVQSIKPKTTGNVISTQPASEQLSSVWKSSITKGLLDSSSARTAYNLLKTAGPRWLVTSVLLELLKVRDGESLERTSDIALAIFHVDITSCTKELLSSCLPQILHNTLQTETLFEPQLSNLARLTSNCVYAASNANGEEILDDVPTKRIKRETPRETVLDALRQLLMTLETGMQDGQLPQQTYFTFQLLKSIVEVKTSRSESVLSAIPPTLGSQLLKILPDSFTPGILLNLHDLHTVQGRSLASRDLCVLRNYQLRNVTI